MINHLSQITQDIFIFYIICPCLGYKTEYFYFWINNTICIFLYFVVVYSKQLFV